MDLKQNPFSLYDFLGYLTPGAIAVYSGILIYAHVSGALTADSVLHELRVDDPQEYVPLVIFAYLVGHLLSFMSSVTVEKYAVWLWGYPSRFLLWRLDAAVAGKKGWCGRITRFFWSPGLYYDTTRFEWPVRFLVGVFALPIFLLDNTVGRLLYLRNYVSRALDDQLSGMITRKVSDLLKRKGGIASPTLKPPCDFFRYVYHFVLENAVNHVPKMQNYVALYGFLRTVCFIVLVAFWSVMLHLLWIDVTGNADRLGFLAWVLIALAILSYVSYLGFMKFYRRFSQEVLMALSVVEASAKTRS